MHVGDGLGGRQRPALLAERLDRRAVDEFHHDEPLRPAADEVVNANDVGVLHGRQELAFGHRGGGGRFVVRIQEPLEHHPAIEHAVLGQVDPAQSAVGQAALDLVLVGDDIAGLERGDERIARSAGRTEARFAARQGRRIALGVVAIGVCAEAPVGRHLRVRHDDLFRVDGRQFRHRHQSQSEVLPRTGRALPVVRRVEPAPRRAELDSAADFELPMAAEPVPPIRPEPPPVAMDPWLAAEPPSAGSRPQRLQKPLSIVPPQPGCGISRRPFHRSSQ